MFGDKISIHLIFLTCCCLLLMLLMSWWRCLTWSSLRCLRCWLCLLRRLTSHEELMQIHWNKDVTKLPELLFSSLGQIQAFSPVDPKQEDQFLGWDHSNFVAGNCQNFSWGQGIFLAIERVMVCLWFEIFEQVDPLHICQGTVVSLCIVQPGYSHMTRYQQEWRRWYPGELQVLCTIVLPPAKHNRVKRVCDPIVHCVLWKLLIKIFNSNIAINL